MEGRRGMIEETSIRIEMAEEDEQRRLRNVVARRRFVYVDRQKQSQPQKISDLFNSPRSSSYVRSPASQSTLGFHETPPDSSGLPSKLPSPVEKGPIIHIESEDIGSPPPPSPPPPVDNSPRKSLLVPSTSENDDVKSQISFIMKERLHTLARSVQRRTSNVRESLLKEVEEDAASVISSNLLPKEEKRPSLMSLIGLQKVVDAADEAEAKLWIPRSINPYGRLYLVWLFVVAFAFLYNAIAVPLRSSYPFQTKENMVYWLIIDYSCDAIYVVDMLFFKPRLQFIKGGITVKTPLAMLLNYKDSFTAKMDLLSVLPTDFLYYLTGPLSLVRANRVFKIQSFWALFDMLDNSVSNPYAIRIARTLSYMIYIIHCNSCIYYMLSAWQAFGQIAYKENGKYYLNKWVYNNQGNAYIRCFYFTAAVATSTGNNPAPTNVIEYIYMTFSWMMGVFVFALLLGQIRDIVSNASRNREDYRRQMDMALSECKRLNLSRELTNRVRDWFIYTWEQQKTLDEKKLIEKLPLKLQTDLALSVHYNTLSKVQLFQDCDRALLRDLVLKLRPVIFLPGDMICQKGDVGKEMYIVNQGVLEVVGGEHNEKVFAELKQGSVFGEISLLAIGGNNRRTASIRAKGYATLFSLTKEDLNDVIKYYPQAQALLKRKAAQMLKNDKKTEDKVDVKQDVQACKITAMETPKMLKIVAEVLPPEKKTTVELKTAMERPIPARRVSIYPWVQETGADSDSNIEFDDSDMEILEENEENESPVFHGDE